MNRTLKIAVAALVIALAATACTSKQDIAKNEALQKYTEFSTNHNYTVDEAVARSASIKTTLKDADLTLADVKLKDADLDKLVMDARVQLAKDDLANLTILKHEPVKAVDQRAVFLMHQRESGKGLGYYGTSLGELAAIVKQNDREFEKMSGIQPTVVMKRVPVKARRPAVRTASRTIKHKARRATTKPGEGKLSKHGG